MGVQRADRARPDLRVLGRRGRLLMQAKTLDAARTQLRAGETFSVSA